MISMLTALLTRVLCVTLIVLFGASSASASTLNAGSLREACTKPEEAWVSFCNGYAQAAVDLATATRLTCIPTGTTRTQIVNAIDRAVFDQIARSEIPAEEPALSVVVAALEKAYPCE